MAVIDASDNEFPKVIFVEGAAPGTPPTGFVYAYAKSDGLLYAKDDTGAETALGADISAHTGDTSDAHDASAISIVDAGAFYTGSDVEAALQEIAGGGGGGGAPTTSKYIVAAADAGLSAEIVIPGMAAWADIRVAAANDDEFDTTDTSDPMTGWTTLGAPTAHDMNSTRLSHYYGNAAAAALGLHGIRKTAPSMPFTMTAHFSDYMLAGGNARAQIAVLETGSGKIFSFGFAGNFSLPGNVIGDIWTTRTSYGSNPVAVSGQLSGVKYVRMVVTNSTTIQCQLSTDGMLWWDYGSVVNPSMTVADVGIVYEGHTSGRAAELLVDWVRFT